MNFFGSRDKDKSRQANAPEHTAAADTNQELRRLLWSRLLKAGSLLAAVFVVILMRSMSWFASNMEVKAGGASLSTVGDVIRIATTGVRQTPEETYLKLNEGTAYTYNENTYYYTDSDEIALRLSEDYIISPGASGSVTFYIIPIHDGAMTATLHLDMAGYAKKTADDGVTKYVERVPDPILDALLSGHILLFDDFAGGHYSNWLGHEDGAGGLNNTITVTLPEDAKADVPYPVTLYWTWPLLYEDMINSLYEADSDEFNSRFAPYIERQADEALQVMPTAPNYRYSRIFVTKVPAGSAMDADARTTGYNLADEYIGANADYLYLTIKA